LETLSPRMLAHLCDFERFARRKKMFLGDLAFSREVVQKEILSKTYQLMDKQNLGQSAIYVDRVRSSLSCFHAQVCTRRMWEKLTKHASEDRFLFQAAKEALTPRVKKHLWDKVAADEFRQFLKSKDCTRSGFLKYTRNVAWIGRVAKELVRENPSRPVVLVMGLLHVQHFIGLLRDGIALCHNAQRASSIPPIEAAILYRSRLSTHGRTEDRALNDFRETLAGLPHNALADLAVPWDQDEWVMKQLQETDAGVRPAREVNAIALGDVFKWLHRTGVLAKLSA